MAGYFSRLFDPPEQSSFFGPEDAMSRGMVVPVVSNFGLQGPSQSEYTDPNDWPWRMYPNVDPKMPFFILPPHTIFNMPVYKWKQAPVPVPPWVDDQGNTHLDQINPDYNKLVTPGRDS